ncbi:hypothetical protein [Aneurinibacillus aneurinilyticus]|uniref:hypothetical protein n=1 Tax=Aneurinibacillus aneurinilyticus TaxID=1391 RepID=UPI003525F484
MSSLESRQEIIIFLLKYLPDISSSLNNIVGYLQGITNKEEVSDEAFNALKSEIKSVLDKTTALYQGENLKNVTKESAEILLRHSKSMGIILNGFEELLVWMSDESKDEEHLNNSINLLFNGGQKIIELVDILTEK